MTEDQENKSVQLDEIREIYSEFDYTFKHLAICIYSFVNYLSTYFAIFSIRALTIFLSLYMSFSRNASYQFISALTTLLSNEYGPLPAGAT